MTNEDLIIKEVAQLSTDMANVKDRLDRIESKVNSIDTVMAGQDKMMKILERLDDERLFMNQKITEFDEDVSKIKLHLKLT